ncbi:MLP-like protein 423 [Salvia hispanica]|uniref:MLP-like protein 423 n=1 Tax=Salvia hispanica TaxID=49212 RepID=UPI002008FD75|nr:MLP-like protein 423 [Salvia hispanica]
MATHKFEIDIELKTSPEKLWKNLKEFITLFPKAMPDAIERIDVIEGDGRSVGTVYLSTPKATEMVPVVSTIKERIDIVDDEKKILGYSILEGDILEYYKNFKVVVYVGSSPKSDGALVKYTGEFNKANENVVVNLDIYKAFVVKLYMDVDAYLLKA